MLGFAKKYTAYVDLGSHSFKGCIATDYATSHSFSHNKGRVNNEILVVASTASKGVKHGQIVDVYAASFALSRLMQQLEEEAGYRVKSIALAINSLNICSHSVESVIEINKGKIAKSDLDKLISSKTFKFKNANEVIVQKFSGIYTLDDDRLVKHPLDMYANTLKASIFYYTTSFNLLRTVLETVKKCYLTTKKISFVGYVEAGSLLDNANDNSTIILNIGHEVTTISCIKKGSVVYIKSIPFGGKNITMDIARAFSLSLQEAERVKILHSTVADRHRSDRSSIDLEFSTPHIITKEDLYRVIHPRVEEILDILSNTVKADGVKISDYQSILLSGGTASICGLTSMIAKYYHISCRVGEVKNNNKMYDVEDKLIYSVLYGLVNSPVLTQSWNSYLNGRQNRSGSLLSRLTSWLKANV